MKLTRRNRAALAASLKLPVAQSFIARCNREEQEFKTLTNYALSMGKEACTDRREWLFTRSTARRPNVRYTDAVSLSKKQVNALEGFLSDGGALWCGLEHEKGPTALLCKHGAFWVVIYEDGSYTSDHAPELVHPKTGNKWPCVLQSSKIAMRERAEKPRFSAAAAGGFSLNRG